MRGRCGVLRRQRGNNWNQGLVGVKKKTKTLHTEAHLAFSVWVSTKKVESISINKNPNDCKLEHLPQGVLQSVQHSNDLWVWTKELSVGIWNKPLSFTKSCAVKRRGSFAQLSLKLPCSLFGSWDSKKWGKMTLSYWLYGPTYTHLGIVTKCCYEQSCSEESVEFVVQNQRTLAKQETHNNTGRVSSLRPF